MHTRLNSHHTKLSIYSIIVFGCTCSQISLHAQINPGFNVSLRLDFSAAEQLIEMGEGRHRNVQQVAMLPGNQIAAATSMLLARAHQTNDAFIRELELFRDNFSSREDHFGLADTRKFLSRIKALLVETKRRQLDRRIVATIEQFFPGAIRINTTIPVYFVAMGHENAAAFVRRVRWHGSFPEFVGEKEGELIIVVNLTRSVQYTDDLQTEVIEMMSTLAHETFHAAFGVVQQNSPVWKEVQEKTAPVWALAELVQNEGIAYYLTMQQRLGGTPPQHFLNEAKKALPILDTSLKEIQSPWLTIRRARELVLNANLSGSFEKNYGATAGLFMAYAIDAKLGRAALAETVTLGPELFFSRYAELARQYNDFPKLSKEALAFFEL